MKVSDKDRPVLKVSTGENSLAMLGPIFEARRHAEKIFKEKPGSLLDELTDEQLMEDSRDQFAVLGQ